MVERGFTIQLDIFLGVAYDLLDRDEFVKVVNSHLERRKKGQEMDNFAKWR